MQNDGSAAIAHLYNHMHHLSIRYIIRILAP